MKTFTFFITLNIVCSCTLTAQWIHIGLEGKSIKDIAVGNNAIFAVTADSGSVYRSTDGGNTWTMTLPSGAVNVAASPSGTFFAGPFRSTDTGTSWQLVDTIDKGWETGQSDISVSPIGVILRIVQITADMWTTAHLNRSTDDGLSWQCVNTPYDGSRSPILVPPVFLTSGDIIIANHCNGFLSTDDGVSWSLLCAVSWVRALILKEQLYFSGWQYGLGMYRSTEMCVPWTQVSSIIPEDFLALPSSGFLAGANGGGLYLFNDDGDSLGTLNEGLTNLNVHTLAIDSLGYVYAGTDSGVFKRKIQPTTQLVGLAGRSIRDIAVGNNALFAVTADSGSVYRSTDGGNLCEVVFTNSISQVAVAPSSTVFGIKKGSWLKDSLFRSTDNGTTWIQSLAYEYTPEMTTIAIGTSGTILVGQRYDFIGGIQWGIVMRSTDNGLSWSQQDYVPAAEIAFNGLNVVSAGRYGGGAGAGTSPQISISTDDGLTWANGEYELPSPTALVWTHAGIFYGGRDETCCPPETTGGLYFSIDTCKTWEQISSIIPTTLIALPSDKVLAGTNGGGIYLFSEDGDSLGTINEGLINLNVHTLAMDSLGYVYAGTDSGVFTTYPMPKCISQTGWNLCSFPYNDEGKLASEIYKHSTSDAFYFKAGYEPSDTLYHGKGYWVKCDYPDTQKTFSGHTSCDTIDVNVGWNIIGSICEPVTVSTIQSEPSGIVTSQFFGYDGNSYYETNTISPWKGYWIKVNQTGKLILSTTGKTIASNRIKIVASNEQPPPPPNSEIPNPKSQIPASFALEQNYPNPFNPMTVIRYSLPDVGRDAVSTGRLSESSYFVTLKVYNVLGKEVATLVNEIKQPGEYTVSWDANNIPSGVYFYRLTAGSYTETKKLILMK